jgi:hypothetical protein
VLLLLFVDLIEVYPAGSIGCLLYAESALSLSIERYDPSPLKGVVSPE